MYPDGLSTLKSAMPDLRAGIGRSNLFVVVIISFKTHYKIYNLGFSLVRVQLKQALVVISDLLRPPKCSFNLSRKLSVGGLS